MLVFVLYFASILAAVPKHWGVPYKDRLSRFLARSRSGLAVEALNACFSLVSERARERLGGVCVSGVWGWVAFFKNVAHSIFWLIFRAMRSAALTMYAHMIGSRANDT